MSLLVRGRAWTAADLYLPGLSPFGDTRNWGHSNCRLLTLCPLHGPWLLSLEAVLFMDLLPGTGPVGLEPSAKESLLAA